MDDDPPVSRRLFYKRFHACYDHAWYHLHHRCRRLCNFTNNNVRRVPKRERDLEQSGPGEEIFWGLYAREWASPWAFVIWSIVLFLLPQVPFVVVWMLSHPGDVQGALAPWSICLAVLPLFWGSLWLGTKDSAPFEGAL